MPSLVGPVSIPQRRERTQSIGIIILQGKPKYSGTNLYQYYFVHHMQAPRDESILSRREFGE